MLQVNDLSIAFGSRFLFDNISFSAAPLDRIGLVGKNGAGKSTLLKAINGEETVEKGSVVKPNGYKIGFLKQEIRGQSCPTIWEEARSAFNEAIDCEKRLHVIEHEMETRTDYSSDAYMDLTQELVDIHEKLDYLDYYNIDRNIEMVLRGLGFERTDFPKPPSSFSGGWAMRLELAKILLQRPDLLLLDEPTNHLDIESILWLENFMQDYPGAVILVSHDRTFLDNVTNRTIEIELGKVYEYKANYSKYLILREERREKQIATYKNQQEQIKQIERNIERFKAKASKASFAQSLVKKLDKMDVIEVDEGDHRAMRFKFPEGQQSGRIAVVAKNVSKSFGPKLIFEKVNLEINRGEKVAFIGKNGMGKTTLARILTHEIEASGGSAELGYNVQMAYFAQHHAENLPKERTILEYMEAEADFDMVRSCRNILGAFLFSGEEVEKKISVLSGGERARVCLAHLLLKPSNLLILDEPTNHLDLISKDVLKQAIETYQGTVIIISHDRDFLDGLVDKVIEFKDHGVKEHACSMNEFFEIRKLEDFRALEQEKKNAAIAQAAKPAAMSQEEKKEQDKVRKQLKNKIDQLEKEVSLLETAIQALTKEIAENPTDIKLAQKYTILEKDLEKAMEHWEIEQNNWEALG